MQAMGGIASKDARFESEVHADLILGAYEATPDISLAELQALLAEAALRTV